MENIREIILKRLEEKEAEKNNRWTRRKKIITSQLSSLLNRLLNMTCK